jgi:chlorite dismutase
MLFQIGVHEDSRPGLTVQTVSMPTSQKEAYRFVKYTFFKLDTEWRRLPDSARRASKTDFLTKLKKYQQVSPRTYSLVGTRGDADFMLWIITESMDSIRELHSELMNSELGKYLSTPYSYFAMLKPSEYFGRPSDPEPTGSKYLFVYPFTKKREWYSIPFEGRRRIMKDHVQIGHKFSSVTIHTAYCFGLDDYEFILSFESDKPEDFLNLVMELRSSEASKYTAVETPIFTCTSVTPEEMLDLLGP